MQRFATWTLALCVGLACSKPTARAQSAQPNAIAGAEFEFIPTAQLEAPRPSAEGFRAGFSTLRLWTHVPVPVGNKGTVLLPGVTYSGLFADTENGDIGIDAESYHAAMLSLAVLQPLGESWLLFLSAATGFASDFRTLDGDSLRLSGTALAAYAWGNKLQLGGGLSASFLFGRLLPIPVATVDWTPTDSFQLVAMLPATFKAVYRFAGRVEVGGAAFLQGNRFSVDSTANAVLDNVGYTVGHAGLTSGVRVHSGFWLNGYVGHTFFRRFEVFDDRDNKLSELDINNTWVAKATLEWRVEAPRPGASEPGAGS